MADLSDCYDDECVGCNEKDARIAKLEEALRIISEVDDINNSLNVVWCKGVAIQALEE